VKINTVIIVILFGYNNHLGWEALEMNAVKIKERTEQVSASVEELYSEDVRVDTDRLAILLGFKVSESKQLPDNIDAKLFVSADGGRKQVIVNAFNSAQKRFAVVYELSYYFLHYRPSSGEEFNHEKGEECHIASIQIAEKILVSRQHLQKAIELCPGFTLADMCRVFDVPEDVMVHQMKAYFIQL